VRQTPNLLRRILSLLDTIHTVENKRKLLQLLTVLGETQENSLEIGRLDGFQTMLSMLASGDSNRQLNTDIVRTLNRFVSLDQEDGESRLRSTASKLAKSSSVTAVPIQQQQGSGIGDVLSAARNVGSLAVTSFASELSKAFGVSDTEDSDAEHLPQQSEDSVAVSVVVPPLDGSETVGPTTTTTTTETRPFVISAEFVDRAVSHRSSSRSPLPSPGVSDEPVPINTATVMSDGSAVGMVAEYLRAQVCVFYYVFVFVRLWPPFIRTNAFKRRERCPRWPRPSSALLGTSRLNSSS
jgi:hypothetical protein